jgi:hypothetical protein
MSIDNVVSFVATVLFAIFALYSVAWLFGADIPPYPPNKQHTGVQHRDKGKPNTATVKEGVYWIITTGEDK